MRNKKPRQEQNFVPFLAIRHSPPIPLPRTRRFLELHKPRTPIQKFLFILFDRSLFRCVPIGSYIDRPVGRSIDGVDLARDRPGRHLPCQPQGAAASVASTHGPIEGHMAWLAQAGLSVQLAALPACLGACPTTMASDDSIHLHTKHFVDS